MRSLIKVCYMEAVLPASFTLSYHIDSPTLNGTRESSPAKNSFYHTCFPPIASNIFSGAVARKSTLLLCLYCGVSKQMENVSKSMEDQLNLLLEEAEQELEQLQQDSLG